MEDLKILKRHLIRIKTGLNYLKKNEISLSEIEKLFELVKKEQNQIKEFYRKTS